MKTLKIQLVFMIFCIVLAFFNVESKDGIKNDRFFIQNIWKQIKQTGIIDRIIGTDFLQGIKSGKLDPWCFSKYIVQDLNYIKSNIDLWDRACKDGQKDEQFLRFCNIFNTSQHDYYAWMKQQLYIPSADPMNVVTDYVNDEIRTYEKNSYHYIAVVYYACLKVYNEIGNELISVSNQQSPYYNWVVENVEFEDYQILETAINYYQSLFDS